MNKKALYHVWQTVRKIRPSWFLIAAALSLVVCIYGLRANNLEMIRLKQAVYQADKDNGDVQRALTDLQRYVTSHMNTSLSSGPTGVYPPIQLKYTYQRLQAANQQKASNEQIYIDAQAHCERLNPTDFSGRNRVPCVEEYVTARGAKTAAIPDGLYKYDFVSPVWSPDLAGFSALATVLFLILAVVLWVIRRWLKAEVS